MIEYSHFSHYVIVIQNYTHKVYELNSPMRNTQRLLCIILLEMIILLSFIDKSELFKERYKHKRVPGLHKIQLITSLILIVSLSIIYLVSRAIQRRYKINSIFIMIFIIMNLLVYIEYKMTTNKHYSTRVDSIQNALDRAQTGDFIFGRSYESTHIFTYLFFRIFSSFISSKPFFSHIGMIVKINNVPYILESTVDIHYCVYAKKNKTGVQLIHAYDRINDYPGRIYLSRNNLHQYIQEKDIIPFMDKYGNMDYLENNNVCITILSMFLSFTNVFKKHNPYMSINQFNNPDLYKVDFQNIENVKLKNKYYYEHENIHHQ